MPESKKDFLASIEQFLKSEAGASLPDPVKDEESRARALVIARRQSELVRRMQELNANNDSRIVSGYVLYSEIVDQEATNKLSLGLFNGQISPWFGIDHIGLHAFDRKPNQSRRSAVSNPLIYFPQYFDIETQTLLWVGKPTDKAIKPQVSQLLQDQQIIPSSIYQIYVFGEDGRYGHVSGFPRSIIDKRPDIGSPEMTDKHVAAPMTDLDFTTAEVSLSLLEAAIQ